MKKLPPGVQTQVEESCTVSEGPQYTSGADWSQPKNNPSESEIQASGDRFLSGEGSSGRRQQAPLGLFNGYC